MDGIYYCYTALPFGLSLSPLIYTKLMRVVITFLRRPQFANKGWFGFKELPAKVVASGFRGLIYLDDIVILMRNNKFVKRRIKLLRCIIDCFGLAINEAKSCTTPRTRFEHLGLLIDLK